MSNREILLICSLIAVTALAIGLAIAVTALASAPLH